jgi:uncharacterized protein YfiM (DUF2279 family)
VNARNVFAALLPFIIVSCAAPVITWDKWAHIAVSGSLTCAGAVMAAEAGAGDGTAIACGAGLALWLGVVKEYSDSRAGGSFDFGDLAADAAGILTGAAVSGLTTEE